MPGSIAAQKDDDNIDDNYIASVNVDRPYWGGCWGVKLAQNNDDNLITLADLDRPNWGGCWGVQLPSPRSGCWGG